MIYIANLIIPIITLIVIVYALTKKINIYEQFLIGVKEGLKISLDIFPSMFAMILAVTTLVKSNALYDIASVINISLFPKEIIPIALMRPVSASSSMMILNDLLKTYGVDSLIGKISSIIAGSTDTTIYIIALYFSSIKIKKIRYAVVVGLFADLACIVLSILIVNLI